METVSTEVTIYNLSDLYAASRGDLAPDRVRKVTVPDALVDPRITSLALPPSVIQQLGLHKRSDKATDWGGENRYDPVRVEIMGRDGPTDPVEIPEGTPVRVGHTILTMLDWVVDLRSRKLIGNPAHDGEQIIELY